MNLLQFASWAGLTLLTGCALSAGPAVPVTPGETTLTLMPSIQDGGLQIQSLVSSYTKADIHHLQLRLFSVSNGSEIPVSSGGNPVMIELPQASLSIKVTIAHLTGRTLYRVRAYAFADAPTRLISTVDGSSSVQINVGVDERPLFAEIPVQLINRVFNGQATASFIDVTDGVLQYTGFVGLTSGLQVGTP